MSGRARRFLRINGKDRSCLLRLFSFHMIHPLFACFSNSASVWLRSLLTVSFLGLGSPSAHRPAISARVVSGRSRDLQTSPLTFTAQPAVLSSGDGLMSRRASRRMVRDSRGAEWASWLRLVDEKWRARQREPVSSLVSGIRSHPHPHSVGGMFLTRLNRPSPPGLMCALC